MMEFEHSSNRMKNTGRTPVEQAAILANRRANNSAWSRPRRRTRAVLVGAHVTTSQIVAMFGARCIIRCASNSTSTDTICRRLWYLRFNIKRRAMPSYATATTAESHSGCTIAKSCARHVTHSTRAMPPHASHRCLNNIHTSTALVFARGKLFSCTAQRSPNRATDQMCVWACTFRNRNWHAKSRQSGFATVGRVS